MQICCVGAGPRGLLLLNRLVAWHRQENLAPSTVTLFDPYPIGGRVWQVTQAPYLLMNTIASQITLFYDQTVRSLGPLTQGPSLFAWAHQDAAAFLTQRGAPAALLSECLTLAPNAYASRALYGYYQQWCFAQMQATTPTSLQVRFVQEAVTAISPGFTVTTPSGAAAFDAVVLALGNLPNALSAEQRQLQAHAQANGLHYLPPGFPGEGDLSGLGADQTVAIRGLGLSAHDFIARLTIGRGGFYRMVQGQLTYQPSGNEPHLLAGSRRGLPYHAKGINQKAPGELTTPRFLTDAQFAAWQAAGGTTSAAFMTALRHEVEFTYYSLLLPAPTTFQLAFAQSPDQAITAFIPAAKRLDWDRLLAPSVSTDWDQTITRYLQADIASGAGGTKSDPLAAALEVFRDLRERVRQLLDQDLLEVDDRYQFFHQFNRTNNFLSIGPPLQRNRELLALHRAKVLTLLPPQMHVQTADRHFLITAGESPTSYHADALIDARVPAPNVLTSLSPLMQQLLADGLAAPLTLQLSDGQQVHPGALAIDPHTHQLLDAQHHTNGHLYAWGVPTEGVHWLTNTSPRPLVNDVNLRVANQLARRILAIPD